MTLGGRTALVTGASRGLGRAIAYRLAMEGAAVAINYSSRKDDAESLAEEIRSVEGWRWSCNPMWRTGRLSGP